MTDVPFMTLMSGSALLIPTRLGGFTTRTVWLLERDGLRVSRP